MTYNIHPEYCCQEPKFFDDTPLKDEYQREVYERARELAIAERLYTVVDIGCGSGYKLRQYFSDRATIGIDLPPTVEFLRHHFSEKCWLEADWDLDIRCDLVIASDVIEHLSNPDLMLDFVEKLAPKFFVLSTPDRTLFKNCAGYSNDGPPLNPCHAREWDFHEFQSYVGDRFAIVEHQISNASQGTQYIIGKP